MRRGKVYVGFNEIDLSVQRWNVLTVSSASISNIGAICAEEKWERQFSQLWKLKESGNLACRVNKQIKQDAHVQASPRCRISASLFVASIHSRRVAGEDEARDANTQYIRRL
jgi:hypothetical protein